MHEAGFGRVGLQPSAGRPRPAVRIGRATEPAWQLWPLACSTSNWPRMPLTLPIYALMIFAVGGLVVFLLTFLIAFFHPGLEYRIPGSPATDSQGPEFARMVALIADSEPRPGTNVEVLTNGECFYEAELRAIREAKRHICIEAYSFQKGRVASRFLEALAERARAGVEVRVLLDAIGSFNTWRHTFRDLLDAGGDVRWYNAVRWYNLPRINNRTHRELLVVDGVIGFLGGAGIADHWWK